MKRDEFFRKDKKVGGTTSVEILEIDYLGPDYTIKLCPNEKAIDTGLVKFGELVPKHHALPKFIFRWDESDKTLDVDIYIGGELAKDLWDQPGYKGHHPPKKNGSSSQYILDIWIPRKQVFKGIIDIGIALELRLRNSGALSLEGQVPIRRIGPVGTSNSS